MIVYARKRIYSKDMLKIERCGSFGNDSNRKCHFNCPAGKNYVVITPNLKVYPCLFLTTPEFEIGRVVDDKIILFKDISNDGTKCIAKEIYNR